MLKAELQELLKLADAHDLRFGLEAFLEGCHNVGRNFSGEIDRSETEKF